ncbi:MAG: hypothetical protein LC749_14735, partial [Actinobacteria bacterium]|nr:hypothetical protein [Actinomycetota bacterium]
GDAAGLAAVAAGLAGLVEGQVERPVAEPPAAAEDEAAGVVRAGPRGLGRGVTTLLLMSRSFRVVPPFGVSWWVHTRER